ncbi:hypothetical protein CRE_00632 [Caenorhabditis remanei]|uniref:Uncharacterized protein n=1 Tax=Caenorhabditis remanei TaxID=31234 RepID=E3LDJ8_CAERE|nr:hypothetical protein CRE_00632 [Caenorhabditis remanei]
MADKSVEEATAEIRSKHPHAIDDKKTIEPYLNDFYRYEEKMGMENIILRMISLPKDKTGSHLEGTTFHWGFYTIITEDTGMDTEDKDATGSGTFMDTNTEQIPPSRSVEKKIVHIQKLYPNASPKKESRPLPFSSRVERKQITYSAYIDMKGTIDSKFSFEPNYFVPTPDRDLETADQPVVRETLARMKSEARTKPGRMREIDNDCEDFILDHFEDLCEEYHDTRNPYFLARADFYRKLDVEHLSLNHKILISADERNVLHGYFLEKMLRTTYSDRIGSL